MATSLQAFDGDTLEAVLARVTAACGPDARIAKAEKVRTGGVAGFFARERFEVFVELETPDVPEDLGSVAAVPAPSEPAPPPPEPASLLELADQVSDLERVTTPSTEGRTFQEVLRGITAQLGSAPFAVPDDPAPGLWRPETELRSSELPGRPEEPAQPEEPQPDPADVALFGSLGIPQGLLGALPAEPSVTQRLLAVLERVPPAPAVIAGAGDVVVVVGQGRDVVSAAEGLARQVGQAVDAVVVAAPDAPGPAALQDPAAAEERVALWRRCGAWRRSAAPFVVAVCAPAGSAGTTWAREMLEALDPVVRWGAVTADRKPEDIGRWVDAIGGVDALAVSDCQETVTPAAVLAAGVPVVWLEGRRATPAAWTALLAERLSV